MQYITRHTTYITRTAIYIPEIQYRLQDIQ